MQPLLQLTCLQELDFKCEAQPLPIAKELQQLSSLEHLKAVSLASDFRLDKLLAPGVEQGWGALPLTSLVIGGYSESFAGRSALLPATALHVLSRLTLLQCLTLSCDSHLEDTKRQHILDEATFAQLAAVLQQLTA
jgi:hypothetical protein